jgi:hypothetical protein
MTIIFSIFIHFIDHPSHQCPGINLEKKPEIEEKVQKLTDQVTTFTP